MTSIKVGIKFRPILKSGETNKVRQWMVDETNIESTNGKYNLTFDNVFDESTSTSTVFEILAKPIILKAMEGFNGTIFAYGQTSSGKTHTMIGSAETPGIIPLAISDIFTRMKASEHQFAVHVGYIEIYNDKVYDLLDDQAIELKVFELQGEVVVNQQEFIAESEEDVIKYFNLGNKSKRTGETVANERSSRSHTIFKITIVITNSEDGRQVGTSRLYFVDLAGSEKPNLTSANFKEGLHINKSLLALGKIIRGLSKNSAINVNFRECKLTRILSPALGGSSLTAVICTVSPVVLDETYRTICFAQDAKKIKVNPTINPVKVFSTPQVSKNQLRYENASLRKEILMRTTGSEHMPTKNILKKRNLMNCLENDSDDKEATKKLKVEDENVPKQFVVRTVNLLMEKISDWEKEKREMEVTLKDQLNVIDRKDEEVTFLKVQLEEAEKINADLKTEIQSKTDVVEGKRIMVISLECQLEEAERKNVKLETKLQSVNKTFEKKLEALQNRVEDAVKRNTDLEDEIKFDKEEVQKAGEEINRVISNLEKGLADIEKEKTESIANHEEIVQQKDATIQSLENQLIEARNQIAEMNKLQVDMKTRIHDETNSFPLDIDMLEKPASRKRKASNETFTLETCADDALMQPRCAVEKLIDKEEYFRAKDHQRPPKISKFFDTLFPRI